MKPLFAAIAAVVVVECLQQMSEHQDRWMAWRNARKMADVMNGSFLNIGCPRLYPFKYPCSDSCLDISEERLAVCESSRPVLGDVRDMPFRDKEFAVALCSHVLEHLSTVDDAQRAVNEMQRVADYVYVVSPDRSSIAAWCHPEHKLWVDQQDDGGLIFVQR